jgi:hypothetical protein
MQNILNTLKILNVTNYHKIASAIYRDYQVLGFYKNFNKAVQTGGAKVKIKIHGLSYVFYKTTDGDLIYYSLHQKDDESIKPECILIIVDTEDKVASLHNISYHPKCLNEKNSSGTALLKLAVKVVRVLKTQFGLKYFHLVDNAFKKCGNKNINLALLSTLIKGRTWYGKHGLRPSISGEYAIDKKLESKYEKNTEIMNTALTKDAKNLVKYLMNAHKSINPTIKLNDILNLYKQHCNDKLSLFLSKYLENYDKTCLMFLYFMNDLAEDIGIYDFHGKPFIYVYDK